MTTTKTAAESGIQNEWIKAYEDGTIGTTKNVRRQPDNLRVAIAHRFTGMLVEIELTEFSTKRAIIGRLVCAATSYNGGASTLVLIGPARLVGESISLALVDSITELTTAEYAERYDS